MRSTKPIIVTMAAKLIRANEIETKVYCDISESFMARMDCQSHCGERHISFHESVMISRSAAPEAATIEIG